MTSKNALSVEVQEHIESVGKADILVGIPSYNNEKTIEHVVKAVQFGLAKHFPKQRAVLMNSDGGSKDKTCQIVRKTSVYGDLDTIFVETPVRPVRSLATPYRGILGKGSAFRAIFQVADQLDVKACILVDSDLRSINPEWVELLGAPVILKEYDFVAPFYSRHKYDATITNAIAYPLTRALYGRRVRQPIGGDFCVSKKLIRCFLQQDVWGTDVARYGIDIWMTTTAINEGFKLCQSFLGAKIHDAKDPGESLGPMFKQVVGTLFRLMGQYQSKWSAVKKSRPIALYGFKSDLSPLDVKVSVGRLLEQFQRGVEEKAEYWSTILTRQRLKQLLKLNQYSKDRFHFPNELWVKTIYDFAIAYHRQESSKEGGMSELMESLVPLYYGRTASFIMETWAIPTYESEDFIEGLAREFEKHKPYLVKNWDFGKEEAVGSKQKLKSKMKSAK
ncbi:glycosyl transferase family 2 [bacterium]|nr:glycosyl transferase family 2 [bacterium]